MKQLIRTNFERSRLWPSEVEMVNRLINSQGKEVSAMNIIRFLLIMVLAVQLSGCVLTKIVTVPMRVVGAVVSIVPVAGNTVHDVVDGAADKVDDIPL
jgi:hypothetical protein